MSISDQTIAVVVPAYNEELLIRQVLTTVPDYVDFIVVVDDASPDRTVDRINEFIKQQPFRIILIQHEENQGVGGAIATGYKWCRDHDVDIAVIMAGDAQMDPTDLAILIDPILKNETDYSKGNRLFFGDAWNKIPRVRYLGNAALSLFTKIASGYWCVADSQCGYAAINRRALNTINWDAMYKRYGQPNDILVRLNIYNFRVHDVVVKPVYGIGEKSGIKPIRMVPKLSLLLLRLFIYRMIQKYVIRDTHPLVLFYGLGFALLTFTIPLFIRFLYMWVSLGSVPEITFLSLLFCLIMSFQLILFGMWFDMEANKHLSSNEFIQPNI
jgi:glycosyltransferase involved in cell wall biosynthesis